MKLKQTYTQASFTHPGPAPKQDCFMTIEIFGIFGTTFGRVGTRKQTLQIPARLDVVLVHTCPRAGSEVYWSSTQSNVVMKFVRVLSVLKGYTDEDLLCSRYPTARNDTVPSIANRRHGVLWRDTSLRGGLPRANRADRCRYRAIRK